MSASGSRRPQKSAAEGRKIVRWLLRQGSADAEDQFGCDGHWNETGHLGDAAECTAAGRGTTGRFGSGWAAGTIGTARHFRRHDGPLGNLMMLGGTIPAATMRAHALGVIVAVVRMLIRGCENKLGKRRRGQGVRQHVRQHAETSNQT
jgi:hypothetical protein